MNTQRHFHLNEIRNPSTILALVFALLGLMLSLMQTHQVIILDFVLDTYLLSQICIGLTLAIVAFRLMARPYSAKAIGVTLLGIVLIGLVIVTLTYIKKQGL